MPERPTACPACGGTALIRSGHACGRQRWRCKGCGRQLAQPYIEGHYDSRNGVKIDEGHIRLPEGPGLGVVPEEGMFGEPELSVG